MHSALTIATIADCARHRHGLTVWCASCERWGDLNVVELTMRGYGERRIDRLAPRCRRCGRYGKIQVRSPWQLPASAPRADI